MSEPARTYAIGDIHGRLDLLKKLMQQIGEDCPQQNARLIFLGDYIDRGLYSAQVLDFLISLRSGPMPVTFLLGNHEQVMRNILRDTNTDLLQDWLRFGGRETLMSYGIAPPRGIKESDFADTIKQLDAKLPASHRDFLDQLENFTETDGYFFCHAGVRPGVPLAQQTENDLAWIRHDFLRDNRHHGKIIVHGHTICAQAEMLANRINIDTGAYASGCLTALGIEGGRTWLLQTA